MDGMKRCPSCGEKKPLSEFYKNRRNKSGVGSYCKICDSKQTVEWQKKNPEKYQKKLGKWKSENKDRLLNKIRQWRDTHKDRVRAYDRNSYARKAGAKGTITEKEWNKLCEKYGNKCLRCGKIDVFLTPDHIVPLKHGGENTIENIQPLCQSCNSIKNDEIIDYRPK